MTCFKGKHWFLLMAMAFLSSGLSALEVSNNEDFKSDDLIVKSADDNKKNTLANTEDFIQNCVSQSNPIRLSYPKRALRISQTLPEMQKITSTLIVNASSKSNTIGTYKSAVPRKYASEKDLNEVDWEIAQAYRSFDKEALTWGKRYLLPCAKLYVKTHNKPISLAQPIDFVLPKELRKYAE